MKLYTKTGDDGATGLIGGRRVDKDHIRVESYGAVDELNACLGMAAALGEDSQLNQRIAAIQNVLFSLGADLATPSDKTEDRVQLIGDDRVQNLEQWIDEAEHENVPLGNFVLPGGCELSARLHVARTVCRRAERRLVTLRRTESVPEGAIRYLNRLSDLLFAWARLANRRAGVPDVIWTPRQGNPQ